jgi:hypothetical protein
MFGVQPYFYIAPSISSPTLTKCNPAEGDYLIAHYPNKFFLAFTSTKPDGKASYKIIA